MRRDFAEFLKLSYEWELAVKRLFEARGFEVFHFQRSQAWSQEHQQRLRQIHGDPAIRLARFFPDLVAYRKDVGGVMLDAKAEKRTDTPNVSVELQAVQCYNDLAPGVGAVLVVFNTEPASFAWSTEIDKLISKRFEDPAYLGGVSGSGTPFGLIRKSELRPLSEWLDKPRAQSGPRRAEGPASS